MNGMKRCGEIIGFLCVVSLLFVSGSNLFAQSSLDLSINGYGISIGNSRNFNGLRFNFSDHYVDEINGINVTLWRAKNNKMAHVNGVSLGTFPEAGYLKGIQLGLAGVAAEHKLSGISFGLLGIGSGNTISGLAIGGLGAGSGASIHGIVIGGLGAGSGMDIVGICIAGLGAGAGNDIKGLTVGLLGAGAGRDVWGVTFAGLGAGAGRDMIGFNVGLVGVGAGNNMIGLTIGGIGAGSGNLLKGLTIAGVGAGAPEVNGITIAGFGAGGETVKGITLALGTVQISEDGQITGLAASAFNRIKGRQNGVTFGVVNYAWHLNGIQIGLINYVRDNPKGLKILPLINIHID